MTRWNRVERVTERSYRCGHCDNKVGPSMGYTRLQNGVVGLLLICPTCDHPTYLDISGNRQVPAPILGNTVTGITDLGVEALYAEARRCSSVQAFTACVMACRKILMNVSVHLGAPTGQSFA